MHTLLESLQLPISLIGRTDRAVDTTPSFRAVNGALKLLDVMKPGLDFAESSLFLSSTDKNCPAVPEHLSSPTLPAPPLSP